MAGLTSHELDYQTTPPHYSACAAQPCLPLLNSVDVVDHYIIGVHMSRLTVLTTMLVITTMAAVLTNLPALLMVPFAPLSVLVLFHPELE